jgi:predicted Zn-dependent protease
MVAAVVTVALVCAPATPFPVVGLAAAQEAPVSVYGPLPMPQPSVPGIVTTPPVPVEREPPASQLPDLGDSSQVALTPAQERKIGEQIVRQIRAQGFYLQDPEVNDYLNELGRRLVAASRDTKQDFEFFAVPDPQINAFALPGGYIGVHTGLILLAQNESELASVLAHEISHVTQRHMARMVANQKNSMLLTLAGLALAILASRAGGANGTQGIQAAVAGSQALAMQNQLNFTRENEYEADRIGFSRLVAAGFDPNGAAVFMERLQRGTRFADNGSTPSYLRTHPITYERIAEAQSRAQGECRHRAQGKKIQHRGGRALWPGGVADAREKYRARENGACATGENGAAASDDRSDGRERVDGRRGIPGRSHPVRKRIAALPEQAAAGLRLSERADQGQPAR